MTPAVIAMGSHQSTSKRSSRASHSRELDTCKPTQSEDDHEGDEVERIANGLPVRR